MKKIITLLLMLSIALSYAQLTYEFSINQDPKLAFMDDEYGNEVFTLDALLEASLYFDDGYKVNSYMSVMYEHALLYGGKYRRTSAEIGLYTYPCLCKNIRVSGGINLGYIMRETNQGWLTYGATSKLTFIINRHLLINVTGQAVNRPDISVFGRFNGYVGLGYNFNKK